MLAFLQVFFTSITYLSQGLKIYQQNYYLDDKSHLLTKNIRGCNTPGLIMVALPKNRSSIYLAIARQKVCQVVRLGTKCMEGEYALVSQST